MASLNMNNYANSIAVPMEQAGVGELSGKLRVLYDSITLSAEVNSGDILNCLALPANARIINAHLKSGALGTGVTASLGISGTAGYLIAAGSVASAAKLSMANEAGLLSKSASPLAPIVTIGGATSSGAAGKMIEVVIIYVLE